MKNSQDYCGVTRNWFTEWEKALENTGKVLHLQKIVLAESLAQAAPGSEGWAEEGGTHILVWALTETGSLAPGSGLLWKPATGAVHQQQVDESGGATGKGWENPVEVRK